MGSVSRGAATLAIEPFEPLSRRDSDALDEESEKLVGFAAEPGEIRFLEPASP